MPFTIVFEGDITELPFNPMKAETVFGKPIASGVGNAFDKLSALEEMADDIVEIYARHLKD